MNFITCYNEAAGWPGIVHGHSEVYFPFASGDLHGPDEGGGVAGDGHGPGHPPGEHEHGVPGDEGGDHPEHQHGHAAHPDGHLPPVPVRHQPRAEGAQSEPGEEKHLGECLEPAVLADQVPLRHHGGHPEAVIELIVHTAGDTVAEELLVLGHHPGADLLGDQAAVVILVILHGPGGRHTQPRVRVTHLGAPEPLLRCDEAGVKDVR